MPSTTIYSQPWDVENRLEQLGLSTDILLKAAEAGYRGLISRTDNDPPTVKGYIAWADTLRGLRDELIPAGWKRDNSQNFSRTFSEEYRISIIVATGDSGTGRSHLSPKTRSSKGQLTAQAIFHNNLQGTLKGFLPEEETKAIPLSKYETWIFLVDTTVTEVRAELSLPSVIRDGEILGWRDRIILPPLEVDPTAWKVNPDDDLGPDFDVLVRRKN